MAAVKLALIAFAGCLIASVTAQFCSENDINNCYQEANNDILKSETVPFHMDDAELDQYCTAVATLNTCIEKVRIYCWGQFFRLVAYSTQEKMGMYICADKTKYKLHRDAMKDEDIRSKWKNCPTVAGVQSNIGLEFDDQCPKLLKFSQCFYDSTAVTTAKEYIKEIGAQIMLDFEAFYNCNRDKTCPAGVIFACKAYNTEMKDYGFPTILDIPAANRDTYCFVYPFFTRCVTAHQPYCNFTENQQAVPYHDMGKYACDKKDDYNRYYSIISDASNRAKWAACMQASGIESLTGNENATLTCGKMETFVDCYQNVPTDEGAKAFIRNWAIQSISLLVKKYECTGSGFDISSAFAVIPQPIMVALGLISALWSIQRM